MTADLNLNKWLQLVSRELYALNDSLKTNDFFEI